MCKRKKTPNTLLRVFFISFLFFLFLLFLYFHNNKYTSKGTQPVNGMLILSEEELNDEEVLYLIDGWQFYPGQLLTPSDFQSEDTLGFTQTISIGKYMDFSMGHRNWRTDGSATYRLNLVLPDTPHDYTLYLEEIYSSYYVYVNGELLCSVGNPEPEQYQEAITNSEITFMASGSTELILAVTNHSHYYSGITYPPAFGLSHAVTQIHDFQLLICMATLSILILCMIFAFYLGHSWKMIHRRTLLYCLLCLCLCISLSYRIVFTFFTISTKLWYPLELFSIYATYLLSVLLLNDIRKLPLKKSLYICIPLALFCIAAAVFGLTSHHSYMINLAFQYTARIMKLAVAAYLLYHTVSAVLYDEKYSSVMLTGSAVSAVSVFADRIFPLYEPIYGCWFVEYGMIFQVLCFGVVIINNLNMTYSQQLTFQEERRLLSRQLTMQKLHYQQLNEKIEYSIQHRHDERHFLNTMLSLLEKGEIEQLKQYLLEYSDLVGNESRIVLCNNMTIDAILQFYNQLCRQTDIRFTTEIDIPAQIPISDIDLTILFSNLIENAYEACIDQEPESPYILVISRYRQDTLLLRIKNNITQKPTKTRNGLFKSTKHAGTGIGTQSVETIVKEHGGQLSYDITDEYFQVSLTLS